MIRRRLPKADYELVFVPSEEGLPPGGFHPFRGMGEDEREALLIEAAVRILRESGTPAEAPREST